MRGFFFVPGWKKDSFIAGGLMVKMRCSNIPSDLQRLFRRSPQVYIEWGALGPDEQYFIRFWPGTHERLIEYDISDRALLADIERLGGVDNVTSLTFGRSDHSDSYFLCGQNGFALHNNLAAPLAEKISGLTPEMTLDLRKVVLGRGANWVIVGNSGVQTWNLPSCKKLAKILQKHKSHLKDLHLSLHTYSCYLLEYKNGLWDFLLPINWAVKDLYEASAREEDLVAASEEGVQGAYRVNRAQNRYHIFSGEDASKNNSTGGTAGQRPRASSSTEASPPIPPPSLSLLSPHSTVAVPAQHSRPMPNTLPTSIASPDTFMSQFDLGNNNLAQQPTGGPTGAVYQDSQQDLFPFGLSFNPDLPMDPHFLSSFPSYPPTISASQSGSVMSPTPLLLDSSLYPSIPPQFFEPQSPPSNNDQALYMPHSTSNIQLNDGHVDLETADGGYGEFIDRLLAQANAGVGNDHTSVAEGSLPEGADETISYLNSPTDTNMPMDEFMDIFLRDMQYPPTI